MNEELISQFIDDELSLDEKLTFVNAVHQDPQVRDDTVSLLMQEKELRASVFDSLPAVPLPLVTAPGFFSRFRIVSFASGMAVAAMLVLGALFALPGKPAPQYASAHRFVIYAPTVSAVGISGTFTDWAVLPMSRVGESGYWETQIFLPQGEHRFSYVMEGRRRVPDPTIPAREFDDFGGVNSIIEVAPAAT